MRQNLCPNSSAELGVGAGDAAWMSTGASILNSLAGSSAWASRAAQSIYVKRTGTAANQGAFVHSPLATVLAGAHAAAIDLSVLSKGAGKLSAFLAVYDSALALIQVSPITNIYIAGDNMCLNPSMELEGYSGSPWLDLYAWFPNNLYNAVQNAYERSTVWAAAGTRSLYYKATATGPSAHTGVNTVGPQPVIPGETITFSATVNVVQKPAAGQAAYLIWTGPPGWVAPNGERHGAIAPSTGVQTLSCVEVVPAGATGVIPSIANGGGGAGGSPANYQNTGEVSEFYVDNASITSTRPSDGRVVVQNFVFAANAAYARLQIGHNLNLQSGEVFEAYFDGAMLERGPSSGSYADGETPDWQWDEVPRISASRSREAPRLQGRRRINDVDTAELLALIAS